MPELFFVFVAGFLGSSHCIGMCGPFAIALGSGAGSWSGHLRRQSIYSVGRVCTYSLLGAMSGFLGLHASSRATELMNIPAALALLAGGLLIYQGLATVGLLHGRRPQPANGPCLAGTFFAGFLNNPRPGPTFLAGIVTGFLPCGLLYGFLALAASSADMLVGAATMACFGLGTVPIMMLTGLGGSLLNLTMRRKVTQFAAWCVVLTGIISVMRGIGFTQIPLVGKEPFCPLCP